MKALIFRMIDPVSQLLQVLQKISQAGIRLTCVQLAAAMSDKDWATERELKAELDLLERQAMKLLATMTADQRSETKLARALFLQMLIESAPKRLRAWSDQDRLDQMPPSRLFEWISLDHEQLELAQLETQMTPEEARRYVNTSLPL